MPISSFYSREGVGSVYGSGDDEKVFSLKRKNPQILGRQYILAYHLRRGIRSLSNTVEAQLVWPQSVKSITGCAALRCVRSSVHPERIVHSYDWEGCFATDVLEAQALTPLLSCFFRTNGSGVYELTSSVFPKLVAISLQTACHSKVSEDGYGLGQCLSVSQ